MKTSKQPYEDLIPILEEVKGDSTLYAGMIAHLGDKRANQYVSKCIDVFGQIWRNPEAAEKRFQYENSCSRDMLMGVLLSGNTNDLLHIAAYLRKFDGLLCPKASDNRNKIGVMGWAQLGVALGGLASISTMSFKGFLLFKLFKPLLGFVTLLEAVTVYEKYQINLVYCTLMLYRDHGVAKLWEPVILKVIRKLRGQNDMVLNYLEGNLKHIQAELPHMYNRRTWAVANQTPVKDWPLDTFTIDFPSEAFIYWLQNAALKLYSEIEAKQNESK